MRLRTLEEKDASLMLGWMHDATVNQYFHVDFAQMTLADALQFIRSSQTETDRHYAICDDADEYQGTISLKHIQRDAKTAEYAIVLRREAQGKGFASFATREIFRIAFAELALREIRLNVLADNHRAQRFYEHMGFRRTSVPPDAPAEADDRQALDWYKISAGEYRERGSKAGNAVSGEKKHETSAIEDVKFLQFPEHGDARGHMVVIEGGIDVPFEIARAFYIYGSDADVMRGQHANRRSEFVLINVAGHSKVRVRDGKENEIIYCLNRPHTGIYLPAMIWKDMYEFSSDSVLMCLSNTHYDASEYIRDYDAYVKEVGETRQ